jgi:hypothetical protein
VAARKAPAAIYQIKVTLRSVKPPIWRRLLVDANANLAQLHEAIQMAMGWGGYHLHEFECFGEQYGPPSYENEFGTEPVLDERKAKLSSVLGGVGAKATYQYDFGDDWVHKIVVEKVLAPEVGREYPVCVAGKRACPPEDCGGPWGYQDMVADGKVDSEAFSLEMANHGRLP